jgi:hypothetical protein
MALHHRYSALEARLAAAIIAGTLAGCTVAPVAEKPAEEVVKARAQERWDALVNGKIEVAYGYLSPGSQAVTNLEGFRNSIKLGFWRNVAVQKVTCSTAELCEVVSEVDYVYRGTSVRTPLKETWIKQEANWWYVLR